MTNNDATTTAITIVRNSQGDLEVHKPGCADAVRQERKGHDTYHESHASFKALVCDWFECHAGDDGNQIEDVWGDYASEFRFLPCAQGLLPESSEEVQA